MPHDSDVTPSSVSAPWLQWLRSHVRVLVGLLVLLVLILSVRATGLQQWFNLDNLRALLNDHAALGLLLFVALFALGNLLHLPGLIFLAAAVLVLGRVAGGLATYVAASLSCALTFGVVRWVGGNAIQELPFAFARRLMAQLHRHPLRNVILLRMVFQTLATLSYALALSGLRFRTYMLGTLLGLPLPIAGYCVFFDAIAQQMHWAR